MYQIVLGLLGLRPDLKLTWQGCLAGAQRCAASAGTGHGLAGSIRAGWAAAGLARPHSMLRELYGQESGDLCCPACW